MNRHNIVKGFPRLEQLGQPPTKGILERPFCPSISFLEHELHGFARFLGNSGFPASPYFAFRKILTPPVSWPPSSNAPFATKRQGSKC
jgi:hypothetical protein